MFSYFNFGIESISEPSVGFYLKQLSIDPLLAELVETGPNGSANLCIVI